MNYFAGRVALGVFVGVLGFAVTGVFAVDTGIDAIAYRTYVHRDSKTYVRVPLYWGEKIAEPYRLRPATPSSVLSLDRQDPRISVTIVWSPLDTKRPWSDVIRAAEDDNLGEEYGLLVAVYGKNKVARPTTLQAGKFTVFKILLDDGPEGPAKSAGAVYLFEYANGESRWKIKVRAVYPQIGRDEHIKQIEELIGQFGIKTDSEP